MRKLLNLTILGLTLLALVVSPAATRTRAADHLDAPTSKANHPLDINDVYVFHPGSPQDLSRTVLVMTVNPAAGVISGTDFSARGHYELVIDNDGDAKDDIVIRARFGPVRRDGHQRVRVTLVNKDNGEDENEDELLARGLTEEVIEGDDGVRVFAGLRDDPFFFDLASFNAGATFCQPGDSDFFLGLNTSAIVVEVPTELLGSGPIGVWGRTELSGIGQVDRMGRPAILTVFIPPNPFEPSPELEDAFNFGKPKNDQRDFRSEIVNSLTLLYSLNDGSGDDPSDDAATIQAIADILLPDILTVDLSQETGFLNGRNLADDVIDAELGLITEGLITTDCVDNDSTFLSDFPYVGVPNP